MIKLVINNDVEHIISATDFSYSATMGIDNYSEHTESMGFGIAIENLETISEFENVPIETLQINNEQNEKITALNFSENLYIVNYNANIYNNSATAHVNINKVNKIEPTE